MTLELDEVDLRSLKELLRYERHALDAVIK